MTCAALSNYRSGCSQLCLLSARLRQVRQGGLTKGFYGVSLAGGDEGGLTV